MKREKTIVVGAGLAGLTAGAYLARAGLEPLVLEKSPVCGGLAQSFVREGFTFDSGPRAFADSGILRPMLGDLGISLSLIESPVSMGIEKEIVHFDGGNGTAEWLSALRRLFPGASDAIAALEPLIRSACRMAGTLRRVPNPVFKNPLADLGYLLGRFIPWLPSFLNVALRTGGDRRSIESLLSGLSGDPSFRDMVSQHFFKGTPWHFALGYFDAFRDCFYPAGGTGGLAAVLRKSIEEKGGRVETGREATVIRPAERVLVDSGGEAYSYGELLWAADLRSLYARLELSGLPDSALRRIERDKRAFASSRPGESALCLFLAVNESPEHFRRVSRGHFIYTPKKEGLGDLHRARLDAIKAGFDGIPLGSLEEWVRKLCEFSSYEISIPVLRDSALAPEGKTGLCASILCDGEFWELARKRGVENKLGETATNAMIDALERSICPGLGSKLLFALPTTPLGLGKRVGSAGGAITGWSLEAPAPVPSSLTEVFRAVRTPIPHVRKAGQWSYSPSGAPVAILTGRIAAGAMVKRLRATRIK